MNEEQQLYEQHRELTELEQFELLEYSKDRNSKLNLN